MHSKVSMDRQQITAEVSCYSIGTFGDPHQIRVELTCKAGQGPHKPPHDTWAVRRLSQCLNDEGDWEYEPLPSSREDDFLERTRWTHDEALERGLAAWSRYGGYMERESSR
jgi:hypothetical protein